MAKKMSVGNGHLKSGSMGRAAKLKLQKKQAASARASLSRKFAIIGVSFAVLGCLVAIVYQYYYSPVEGITRMNVILRNHVKTALQTIDQKYKFDAYIQNDPLADVIKTKLRPIQERIASLKTQCAQYEKMEQIPGGPKQFIQSSLHELNTDIEQKVFELNSEALTIMTEYVERGNAMVKTSLEMVQTDALRINNDHFKMLTMEGVYFIPVGDITNEELEKAKEEVNLEMVSGIVEELASMYQELEEVGLKLGQLGKELGISHHQDEDSIPDEDYERLVPFINDITEKRQRISDFKEKNNKYVQLFQGLIADQVRALTTAMGLVRENDERRRRPYLNLHLAVTKDIKNLKIRIDNLKYTYAKRKTNN